MKYNHIEFSNSKVKKSIRCQMPLSEKSLLLHGRISIRSEKIFPFASIRKQLASMYYRAGFEKNLCH